MMNYLIILSRLTKIEYLERYSYSQFDGPRELTAPQRKKQMQTQANSENILISVTMCMLQTQHNQTET